MQKENSWICQRRENVVRASFFVNLGESMRLPNARSMSAVEIDPKLEWHMRRLDVWNVVDFIKQEVTTDFMVSPVRSLSNEHYETSKSEGDKVATLGNVTGRSHDR